MSGSISGSRSKGSSSSTTQIDKALVPLRDQILSQSMNLATQGVPQFTGQRVAGFSDAQKEAMNQSIDLGQQGSGLANRGFDILRGIGTADQRIGAYLNPFTSEVIDRSMSDLERQRMMQMQQTSGQALANRAFGGSRQGVAESLTNEAFARQMADLSAQLRMQGFNTALGAAQQDVTQQQSLAQALAQAGYGAIQGMSAAGDTQQQQQQLELDAQREQFYEPINQQMQLIDFLTGVASGVPQGGSTSGRQKSSSFGFKLGFGK